MKYRALDFLQSVQGASPLRLGAVKTVGSVKVSPRLQIGGCERYCGFYDCSVPRPGAESGCSQCYAQEIGEAELVAATGERYQVKGGIPRLVSAATTDFIRKNKKSFSLEWKYSQHSERNWGQDLEFRKKLFLKALGADPESLRGKLIFDAGCGSGLLSRAVAESYGLEVVALDLASGIENAHAQNTNPQVHFIQGSLLEIPLQSGVFDYVYCAGVLIHLPDTREAFDLLPRLLKPGGRLFVWVYHPISDHQSKADRFRETIYQWLRRNITSRLSIKLQEILYFGMVIPFVLRRFALGLFKKANDNRSWREKMQNLVDTFSPTYVNRHTEEEVLHWYRRNGFINCTVAYRERYGFGVRGDLPPTGGHETGEQTHSNAALANA